MVMRSNPILNAQAIDCVLSSDMLDTCSDLSDRQSGNDWCLPAIDESDEFDVVDETHRLLMEIRREIEYEKASSEFEDYFAFIWNWLGEEAENIISAPTLNDRYGDLFDQCHTKHGNELEAKDQAKRPSLVGSLSDVSNDLDVPPHRVEDWARSFEKFLSDPLGLRNFREFLKKEFSEENIQFWIACEEFKLIQDPEKLRKRAVEIFAQFLSPGASLLVNVNQQAYERAAERVQSPTLDMFSEAQRQVYQLMKLDSYMRFLKSDMYKECLVAEEEDLPIPFQEEVEDEIAKDKPTWHARKTRSSARDLLESPIRKPGLLNFLSKGKAGKTMSETLRKERSLSTGSIPDLNRTALNGHAMPQLLDSSKTSKSPSTFVRVILPDGSSAMIMSECGQTIRQSLRDLCESRKMTLATFDVYVGYHKKIMDLDQEMTALEENVIFLERRVLLRLDLPNGRSVGIKSNPSKLLSDVLAPILLKNGFQLNDYAFFEVGDKAAVPLDAQVSSMENKHLVTRPVPKKQDKENVAASKSPLSDAGRSSFRRLRSNSFREEKKAVRCEEIAEKERVVGGVTRRPAEDPSRAEEKERVTRKFSNEMRQFLMGRSRSVDDDGTQALLNALKRSQCGRMEDQRGLIPKNVELPDFLKTSSDTLTPGTPAPVRSSSCSSKSALTPSRVILTSGSSASNPTLANHQLPLNVPRSPLICGDEVGNFRPAGQVLQDASFAMSAGDRSGLCSDKSWRDVQTYDHRQSGSGASPTFSRDLFGEKYSLGTKLSKSDSTLTGAVLKKAQPISSSPTGDSHARFLSEAVSPPRRSPVTGDERLVELMNTNSAGAPQKLCAWRSSEGSLESSSHGSLSSSETLNVNSGVPRPLLSPDSGFCPASSGDLTPSRCMSTGGAGERGFRTQRSWTRPISQQDQTAILRCSETGGYDGDDGDDRSTDQTVVGRRSIPGSPTSPNDFVETSRPCRHSLRSNFPGHTAPTLSDSQHVAGRRPTLAYLASQQRVSADLYPTSTSASIDSSRS